MSGDVRQELVKALLALGGPRSHSGDVADALLPVVERIAAQRAADELRAAADGYDDEVSLYNRIHARADALEQQP